MLWEEQVPLLRQGYHKELVEKAYSRFSKGKKVYPNRENVFDAMRLTSFESVKVVILGQDPYFNEHHLLGPEAHGLCFSVREGITPPPSLRNIFKEIQRSIYPDNPNVEFSTDLTRWAQQGVLLLNASLTVVAKAPNSHANIGWHTLTDNIIETLSNKRRHIVFMLWGSFAGKKASLIDKTEHLVLQTSHPSPLSAHRGFLGSDIFKNCNHYLKSKGISPIQW
ncbi:MAG: uracil-DNA glycosylase [Desulfopila sp.]|jgi:uracil-DNA glycosylase|nr:uracil-DNA glycosylase [Desulfopila sp.]